MNCRIILLFCFFLMFSCDQNPKKINYESGFKNYTNKGFTLIYDEKLYRSKDLDRKMNDRSLLVFSNALKKETLSLDPVTGEKHLRHHMTKDGFFKGRKILDIKTKEDTTEDSPS